MMNEWDRDNLQFIMDSDNNEFTEWLAQADDEDIHYALELIRNHKTELIVQKMELADDVKDTSLAKEFIGRIQNAKNL
jgi:hypothetical protein